MGEAVLHSAVFGGYAKKDVMEYIDSVWNESERKQKVLQSRVDGLKAENIRLKLRLREAEDRRPTAVRQKEADGPAPGGIMRLPEGSYLVEDDDSLLRLPTPGSAEADRVWAQTAASADLAQAKRPAETAAEQEPPSAAEPAEEGAAVRSLQKQLAEERKARAELEAKLAYSTDLLLKICKQ